VNINANVLHAQSEDSATRKLPAATDLINYHRQQR